MSSRVAVDQVGRPIVIVTSPSMWLEVGERFLVADPIVWGLVPPRSGRRATARALAWNRRDAPYNPTDPHGRGRCRQEVIEVPDDQLADAEAIRLAMVEQRRQPADLVNV
jgi:hypothetical protein